MSVGILIIVDCIDSFPDCVRGGEGRGGTFLVSHTAREQGYIVLEQKEGVV